MFSVSKTTLNIKETEGNFIIKETDELGPIHLNSFIVEESGGQYTVEFGVATSPSKVGL